MVDPWFDVSENIRGSTTDGYEILRHESFVGHRDSVAPI